MREAMTQDRSEKATARHRRLVRDHGYAAHSAELNSGVILLFGFFTLYLLTPQVMDQIKVLMRQALLHSADMSATPQGLIGLVNQTMIGFLMIVAPLLIVAAIVAAGSSVAQIGFRFTASRMTPDFNRLNVVSGLRRVLSFDKAVLTARDAVKIVAISFAAWIAVTAELDGLFQLAAMTPSHMTSTAGGIVFAVALKVTGAVLVIAILDYFYQRYTFEKSIRMTPQEVRDEVRDSEINPQVKARIRRLQSREDSPQESTSDRSSRTLEEVDA